MRDGRHREARLRASKQTKPPKPRSRRARAIPIDGGIGDAVLQAVRTALYAFGFIDVLVNNSAMFGTLGELNEPCPTATYLRLSGRSSGICREPRTTFRGAEPCIGVRCGRWFPVY